LITVSRYLPYFLHPSADHGHVLGAQVRRRFCDVPRRGALPRTLIKDTLPSTRMRVTALSLQGSLPAQFQETALVHTRDGPSQFELVRADVESKAILTYVWA
jgi:hypothetical protein